MKRALLVWLALAGVLFAQEPDEMLRRGISLVNAARPSEAEQTLRALLNRDPAQTFARSVLGFLLLQRSSLEEAESSFRAVLAAEPANATARFGLGVVLSRSGKSGDAGREFEQVLADRGVGLKARLHWIDTLFLAGDLDHALREARDACERFPMAPEFEGMLAKLDQARGDPDAALQAYTRAIELAPADPRFYANLIEILRQKKDHSGALHWAERGLEADRDNPVLHEEKAAALDRLGRPAEAQSEREQASRNRQAEITYTEAIRTLGAGDVVRAKQLLEQCVALNPLLSKAWTELGGLLRQERSYEGANRAYVMAIEGDPDNAVARIGMAMTLRAQGKPAEALATLQRAVDRGMKDPDLLAGLAAAYLELGHTGDAEDAMLRAVRELPDDPDLLSYLGYVADSRKDNQAAQQAYARALQVDPGRPDAQLAKARYLMAKGENRTSVGLLRALSKAAPERVEVWHALMEAEGRAADRHGAEQACISCLAHFPTDRDCREQLAYLKIQGHDFRAAAEQFELLHATAPATRSSLNGLAFALTKTGEYRQARRLLEASLKQFGPDPWVYASLGFVHRCRGDIAAAVTSYRQARDLAPADASLQHDLGFALYLARKYEAAVEPLQAALGLKPDWGVAHYDLAMNYWQMKQYPLALKHARIAQEKNVPQAARIVKALTTYE